MYVSAQTGTSAIYCVMYSTIVPILALMCKLSNALTQGLAAHSHTHMHTQTQMLSISPSYWLHFRAGAANVIALNQKACWRHNFFSHFPPSLSPINSLCSSFDTGKKTQNGGLRLGKARSVWERPIGRGEGRKKMKEVDVWMEAKSGRGKKERNDGSKGGKKRNF